MTIRKASLKKREEKGGNSGSKNRAKVDGTYCTKSVFITLG